MLGKQIRTKNDICIIDISDISKEYINLPTMTSHHSSLERMWLLGLIFMLLVSETLGGDFLRQEIFSLYTKEKVNKKLDQQVVHKGIVKIHEILLNINSQFSIYHVWEANKCMSLGIQTVDLDESHSHSPSQVSQLRCCKMYGNLSKDVDQNNFSENKN